MKINLHCRAISVVSGKTKNDKKYFLVTWVTEDNQQFQSIMHHLTHDDFELLSIDFDNYEFFVEAKDNRLSFSGPVKSKNTEVEFDE